MRTCLPVLSRSLHHGPDRTVFVHVPNVSSDLEVDNLGEALLLLIIFLSKLMKLKTCAALSNFFDHKFQPSSSVVDSTN
ncbi:unnamed protein product [Dibothriocephalus latus]|uniref:Uncharacterized protein n=1 Tax=Dibothriocephalus latus TaxID=60516 RepID=A0A3P7NMN3_DIBLA|nr:unnamed protein product [Dibothriocephalus latus]